MNEDEPPNHLLFSVRIQSVVYLKAMAAASELFGSPDDHAMPCSSTKRGDHSWQTPTGDVLLWLYSNGAVALAVRDSGENVVDQMEILEGMTHEEIKDFLSQTVIMCAE